MSNEQNVNVDELELEVDEQVSVGDSATETKESEEDQEAKALQEHKDKVWNGMIDSEILKISKGEKELDDLDPAMRKAVENKMAIKPTKTQAVDAELIAAKVKEKFILDSLLESVEEDKREEVKSDYQLFASQDPSKALEKVRKLHGIKTRDELTEHGERFISTGMVIPTVKRETYTATEKKFLQAMGKKI